MQYMEIEVYSQSIDRGVVRMPSQGFPGLVLQGETLAALLKLAKSAYEKSENTHDTELIDATHDLVEKLQMLVTHYESTLNKHNIPLPYSTIPAKSADHH